MLTGRQRAVAEVDLEAIRHNVRRLMRDLPEGAVHCAVVKADGYGHGAVPVARAALEAGATWLGVATAAEVRELRAAGLTAPVLIFGPLTGADLADAAEAGAEVVAWSVPFLRAAARLGVRVHVKVDTGMGRLGVRPDEAAGLCARASEAGVLAGLMSHFATADEEDTAFFELQLGRFTELAAGLKRRYPGLLCHTANSAATLRGPRAHFDMVRTGIAMYGLAPANDDPFKDGLRPAMTLVSHLAGVREIGPGDSVGYGRTWIADEDTRIGVVPVGYADGVRRALGNTGEVLVAGRRCPIVGRISMDQMTVRLPGGWGRPGDEVVLFGAAGDGVAGGASVAWTWPSAPRRDGRERPRILCEEVAALLGTINYEVTCDVAPRVVRRYRGEAPAE
ncbi:MAG: Alanine racemase [Actinobacteria bacterium ADurb.BinA094]|nr:MAG: Alanine racemase [Actinobacteria bacterium ADurb.BinA094]